jgi:hypothetical protein
MSKFQLPVLLPATEAATLTQPFGVTANTLEPVGQHGEPHFHYGVDLVFGDPIHTYGIPLVCPFDDAKLTAFMSPPTSGISTPFIQLEGYGASGAHYKMIFGHVSQINFRSEYQAGDIIGLVGNYGLVWPQPTPSNPFAGAHLHLGVQANGMWIDPLSIVDIGSPFIGTAYNEGVYVSRIAWALSQLEAQLAALISKQ